MVDRLLGPADYDAIFFVGGHGTMWDNPELAKIAADIYEHGGKVAAVCHGPAALVNITLSDGSSLVTGKEVVPFQLVAVLDQTVPAQSGQEEGRRVRRPKTWAPHGSTTAMPVRDRPQPWWSRAVPGAPIEAMWRDGKPAAAPVPADSGEWAVLRSPDAMGDVGGGR